MPPSAPAAAASATTSSVALWMPGHVDQPGGQTDRALDDSVADEPSHPVELGRRRRPGTDPRTSWRREPWPTRVATFTDGRAASIASRKSRQSTATGRGVSAGSGVREPDHLLPRGQRPRRGAAVAHHHRGDALPDRARHLRQDDRRQVGVVVDVDEARGERAPGRVDRAARLGSGRAGPPHRDDPVDRSPRPIRRKAAPPEPSTSAAFAITRSSTRGPYLGRRAGPSGSSAGGQEHAERRAAALALLHPGAAPVELGEPLDERQPDPDAGRVNRRRSRAPDGRARRPLRAARSGIPGPSSSTTISITPPSWPPRVPRRARRPGVWRIAFETQVLDDPLHLGAVDRGDDGSRLDVDRAAVGVLGLAHRAVDELGEVGGPSLRRDDPALQPVEVEEVAEEPLELARVRRDPADQVERVLVRQLELRLLQRERRAEDRRERACGGRARRPRGTCSSSRRAPAAAARPRARGGTRRCTSARTRAAPARPACAR